jgi:hypothetical protein
MLSTLMNINIRFAIFWMKGKAQMRIVVHFRLNGQIGYRALMKKAPIRRIFAFYRSLSGVDDGVRTHDPQNHNLML